MIATPKARILYVMKILLERTDASNIMTAADIINALNAYGFSAERKSIYTDIEILRDFGLDIQQNKGTGSGYYIGKRQFELPELKLLVDAVQSSKFITNKKSEELIKKLESFTSPGKAKQLQRQVFIYNRSKTGNEMIYNNVDKIHAAIANNAQITFYYTEWTPRKEKIRKHDGALYQVSPWALTWDDENYYLVAYDEASEKIKHFRVDKMEEIALRKEKRLGSEHFEKFDLALFARKTFGMYGGTEEKIKLKCKNSLAGVIIDRFGTEIMMIPQGKEYFSAVVPVAVSPQFFGWITGIGEGIELISPSHVREEYQTYLKNLIAKYK